MAESTSCGAFSGARENVAAPELDLRRSSCISVSPRHISLAHVLAVTVIVLNASLLKNGYAEGFILNSDV